MCALEMAALEIQGNGDSGTLVTDEHIRRTVESLEDTQQKDFIIKCLSHDPAKRPSARELLFHSLLFEVHTLKLLAAHCLVNTSCKFGTAHTQPYTVMRHFPIPTPPSSIASPGAQDSMALVAYLVEN